MKKLVGILAFAGAIIVTAAAMPRDALAGHAEICVANTGNYRHVDADPDYWAWGTTTCYLSPGAPDVIDAMYTEVYWEWYDWANYPYNRGWVHGGRYQIGGCGFCYGENDRVQYGTQAHNNLPFPAYAGLICRRARSTHLIWEHLAPEPTDLRIFARVNGICV